MTQLHHTIKDRPSSRLLLAKQWRERISHEFTELHKDMNTARAANDVPLYELAAREYDVWLTRLHEDLDRTRKRLRQDGFEHVGKTDGKFMVMSVNGVKDIRYVPEVDNDGVPLDTYEVWHRAVQS